jgi:hypothetical protein
MSVEEIFERTYIVMSNAVKDAIAEKIEISERWDETTQHKGFNFKLLLFVPVVLAVASSAFLLVRRWFNSTYK